MNRTPQTRALPVPRPVPVPRNGPLHMIDALGYSMAGMQRLWQETAARLEVAGVALGAVVLALCAATLTDWLVFTGLCLAVLVAEALNTALEVLTDRISPEWSVDAKHAKDLGSLAVGLTLCAACGYVILVVIRACLA